MQTREALFGKLAESFDLVVIGGGCNGAGIAREAALRGLRVALLEQGDFASATSSSSSKLIHGGLRYLEQFELGLVFEAVSERRILLDMAPHLVKPLAFLFPVFGDSPRNLWTISAGLWLYEGLSLFRSPKRHRTLSRKKVHEVEPLLTVQGLKGAPIYYDCATDDARLTLETVLDAADLGATALNYTKVTGFEHREGKLVALECVDQLNPQRAPFRVEGRVFVNATGPWGDKTISLSTEAPPKAFLRPTKGIHFVVDAQRLPIQHAVVCFHPADKRLLFAIPWGERTYIGTTDTDFVDDPTDARARGADVDYLLEVMNTYFPDAALVRDDLIATWAGVRPLVASHEAAGESDVSREHRLIVGQDGLVSIMGGKLTTYRRIAEEVVDLAHDVGRLDDRAQRANAGTAQRPLPGGRAWPEGGGEALSAQLQELAPLSEAQAKHLAATLGTQALEWVSQLRRDPKLLQPLRADGPELMAQVKWAVEREAAQRLVDVLSRRTQIFYRDPQQGLGAMQAVAEYMAELLGWSAEEMEAELADYSAFVAKARAWQAE